MRAPVIGITTLGRDTENRFSLSAAYVDAVRAAGGVPLLLPPGEQEVESILEIVDGLIFAGGGDIDPAHFGAQPHPTIYSVDEERDLFELALAHHILDDQLPTLGICRGAQVLAVASGGDLVVDIPEEVGDSVMHRMPPEDVEHPVSIEPGSRLAEIMGTSEVQVPSWHHQSPRGVPDGWRLAALAPDGVIEAIEVREHPYLIAVQWHPERAGYDVRQQRLFRALVQAARERKR